MFLKVLTGAAAALCVAGAANASVHVSIWTDQPGAGSWATISQAASLGTPSATTDVNAIDFDSGVGGYTVGGFLNSPVLPSGVASHSLNNTYMLFTGTTYLQAGANSFVVPHDDGLQLNIDGIGLVVDQPWPTSPVDTPFTVNAATAGWYNFELSYGEVYGAPARLAFKVNGGPVGGVPEPASWGLMLAGFLGLGAVLRTQKRAALA